MPIQRLTYGYPYSPMAPDYCSLHPAISRNQYLVQSET